MISKQTRVFVVVVVVVVVVCVGGSDCPYTVLSWSKSKIRGFEATTLFLKCVACGAHRSRLDTRELAYPSLQIKNKTKISGVTFGKPFNTCNGAGCISTCALSPQ